MVNPFITNMQTHLLKAYLESLSSSNLGRDDPPEERARAKTEGFEVWTELVKRGVKMVRFETLFK